MDLIVYTLSVFLIVFNFLSFFSNQHWVFRIADFVKIQLVILQILCSIMAFIFIPERSSVFWVTQGLLLFVISHNISLLYSYLPFYFKHQNMLVTTPKPDDIKVMSVNVYQYNKQHQKLIVLIAETEPDIVFTMESDKNWETALVILEKDYPYFKKIPLSNEYGMHFYSKLEIQNFQTHFYTSGDLPSIEADIKTAENDLFRFIGVHPSPPSPTQESTSKERDSELLSVAKNVKVSDIPVMVIGDFNNVAWSKSSRLFKKSSGLKDGREGRGFISTFHAKYYLLRFPIDLLYHSPDIIISDLKALRNIGSDHLPLLATFRLSEKKHVKHQAKLNHQEKQQIKTMIDEGKEASNDRVV